MTKHTYFSNMKTPFLIFYLLLLSLSISAQINLQDSTVQAIGYWSKGDVQNYSITEDKYKIQKDDTISKGRLSYDVQITIIDSTKNSFLIEWDYKNINLESADSLTKEFAPYSKLRKAIIRTNEFEAFQELVNWEEVRDDIRNISEPLKKKFAHIPGFDKLFDEMIAKYSNKETIENNAINEIQQFYTFHGGKYNIHEKIVKQTSLPNNYGEKPFDALMTVWVNEVNEKDNNFTLCYQLEVDSTQLSDAVFSYVSKMATNMGIPLPKREEMGSVNNTTWNTSVIHESGWPLYTIFRKETSSEDILQVEETRISLK